MHPACCKHPETCTLTYREHLVGVVLGASAIPSRAVNRTPGQPDEPAIRTEQRQKRWDRDLAAYKRLRDSGVKDVPINGTAAFERTLG